MDSRGTPPAPWPPADSREAERHASETTAAGATQQVIAASTLFSNAFEQEVATNAAVRSACRALGDFSPVDLASVLAPDQAFPLLQQATGFTSYLIAPERGVRRLVADAVQLYRQPMTDAASCVLDALLIAAEDAASKALPEADVPGHLRMQILDQAQACIRVWHSKALAQLDGLLAAECLCPEQEAFADLRDRLQQRLVAEVQQAPKQDSKAAITCAATDPGAPDSQTSVAAGTEAEFFMGILHKRNRHGRFERRWFVLNGAEQALSYSRAPRSKQTRTFVLQGGAVVPRGTADQEPAFHLHVTEQGTPKVLTLRASSHSIKEAWIQQLAAATAGPTSPKAVAPRAALLKSLSVVASGSAGDASPVARKISTAVFPDPVAEPCQLPGDGRTALAPAPNDALLKEISSQAAARSATAHETTVLAAVLEVAVEYVEQGAGRRLRGATQRIVSSAMLLGRREEMRQGLLALLLEAGAPAPALD